VCGFPGGEGWSFVIVVDGVLWGSGGVVCSFFWV
jgi:hypothetical protein